MHELLQTTSDQYLLPTVVKAYIYIYLLKSITYRDEKKRIVAAVTFLTSHSDFAISKLFVLCDILCIYFTAGYVTPPPSTGATRLTTNSPLSLRPQLDSWMCLTPVSFPVLRSEIMGIVARRALKGGRWRGGGGGAGGQKREEKKINTCGNQAPGNIFF